LIRYRYKENFEIKESKIKFTKLFDSDKDNCGEIKITKLKDSDTIPNYNYSCDPITTGGKYNIDNHYQNYINFLGKKSVDDINDDYIPEDETIKLIQIELLKCILNNPFKELIDNQTIKHEHGIVRELTFTSDKKFILFGDIHGGYYALYETYV
jgi:hypothetical protein